MEFTVKGFLNLWKTTEHKNTHVVQPKKKKKNTQNTQIQIQVRIYKQKRNYSISFFEFV